jgi:hypothetical protein
MRVVFGRGRWAGRWAGNDRLLRVRVSQLGDRAGPQLPRVSQLETSCCQRFAPSRKARPYFEQALYDTPIPASEYGSRQ